MTIFLLVLILLMLVFPRFLQALGVLVWIVVGLLWWHWPSDTSVRIEPTPAAVTERVEPAPPPSPNELDFRPVYRPDGKPSRRIQH